MTEELLRQMAGQLAHRGPDEEGFWCDGPIGFGHRRLSIIDVGRSHQPMADVDGRRRLTFNGEILNYRKLRADLDYPFRTEGDTEVVLAAHAQFGARGVERLQGQFAYAYHDGDDLWLARDRMGILPLFYYRDDRIFAFASEIKALLPALPTTPSLDARSLDSYLARRAVAGPFTMLEGIRKVRPGHLLRVGSDGQVEHRSYWSLPETGPRPVSDDDAIRLVEEGLLGAVDRALVADVPVGALLSGGLDSSLVVAMASQHRDREPMHTYAAGFGDPRFDELAVARTVSRRFGTRHHEVVVDADRFSELWHQLTWHRDAPISEPADVAVFELASEARQAVKVVLTGEGSDELFAGYPKYQFARSSTAADWVPAGLRRAGLERAAHLLPAATPRARIALRALSAPDESGRLASWFAPFLASERRQLLGPIPIRSSDPVRSGADAVARMSAYDCGSWLSDNLLERDDRMAMAAGVETRPPYLDHELVDLAFSLPSPMKVRHRTGKWVLKQVGSRYLPSSIVNRPKVGFRVPLDQWFREGLGSMARERLLDGNAFTTTTMDASVVRSLLDSHESGRRDESIRIWTLLSLEVWHDVFFGAARV